MDTSGPVNASEQRSHKWQERFASFYARGGPHSPGFKPALKKLPFLKKAKAEQSWNTLTCIRW
ncbi:hypothetical protein [Pseudomonas viridiflava]|uniref:hypothetical protein n=1 Tax=Pseudomonas viridiflava TaxID=33069 RepID=UPI0018E5E195|nr:hypothetical protein [Pseudomonas viridiflava]MBI6577809.1 hypothetical protein [Pseudomonas viridiflava]MBI6610117.1 hypothetical protein [Pseudomonas viridiflava]MBI6639584.1 hypothetical protein [Pseudomonas viridiflava]MBI6705910.1 hypothetical protein [Pseudomonas viridiflava]MBI6724914.1 hypothetical protein [Pseudomonas viridiflava]